MTNNTTDITITGNSDITSDMNVLDKRSGRSLSDNAHITLGRDNSHIVKSKISYGTGYIFGLQSNLAEKTSTRLCPFGNPKIGDCVIITVKSSKEGTLVNITVPDRSPLFIVQVDIGSQLDILTIVTGTAVCKIAKELEIINIVDKERIFSRACTLKAGRKLVNGDGTVCVHLGGIARCKMRFAEAIVRIVRVGECTAGNRSFTIITNGSQELTASYNKCTILVYVSIPTTAGNRRFVAQHLAAIDGSLTCTNAKRLTAVGNLKRTAVHNKTAVFSVFVEPYCTEIVIDVTAFKNHMTITIDGDSLAFSIGGNNLTGLGVAGILDGNDIAVGNPKRGFRTGYGKAIQVNSDFRGRIFSRRVERYTLVDISKQLERTAICL